MDKLHITEVSPPVIEVPDHLSDLSPQLEPAVLLPTPLCLLHLYLRPLHCDPQPFPGSPLTLCPLFPLCNHLLKPLTQFLELLALLTALGVPHQFPEAKCLPCYAMSTILLRDDDPQSAVGSLCTPFGLPVRGQPLFCSKAVLEFCQLQPWAPSAFFGLQPPPSSRDALKYFLFQAPSSSPQHNRMLLPLQPLIQHPLQRPLQDLCLSEGNLETSLDSTPSDLNSAPTFFGDSPSHSGDRVAPTASDIKGRVIKVIHDIKG